MKKFLAVIVSIVLTIANLCVWASADGIEPRNSNYFTSYGTVLGNVGGGVIQITFDATGTNICSELGVATYSVQRMDDNGNWEDVSGLLSGQTGTNVFSYTFSRYFYGVPGETYRVNVTFFCSLNGGSEFKSFTSGSITAE